MFAITSKIKKKGEREKYKSYVVDMKIKGKQLTLSISIPNVKIEQLDKFEIEQEHEKPTCTNTTRVLSIAKENNNVKPIADVIWLIEHTPKSDEEVLEWAYHNRSKEIHQNVVTDVGESKTQEEILLFLWLQYKLILKDDSKYYNTTGEDTRIREVDKGVKQKQRLKKKKSKSTKGSNNQLPLAQDYRKL
ncbi:hypothetical protein Cgig2_013491 [Carnegiea gigantea]|uniref:Uncharacterized protein n=1 Tax=Carnegiea gigantea TaxID=171969 RepID=A0A9Q1GPK3_9CARY|nr:hypothetical protein Cgig2_013491 [Carnegiea gigantea]